jgi:hypothetical protein
MSSSADGNVLVCQTEFRNAPSRIAMDQQILPEILVISIAAYFVEY